MSGVSVVRHLVAHDSAVLAVVSPATKILVGNLKEGTVLPAISIKQISGTQELDVAMTSKRLRTHRVQVTVHAVSGKQQQQLIALVLAACPNTSGTLNGIHVDSILPAGEGPDLSDPDIPLYEQSCDFIVRWFTP